MNPQNIFCSNPDCPTRGRCSEGNIRIHARTAAGVRGRVRGLCRLHSPHGPFTPATARQARTPRVAGVVRTGDRAGGEAAAGGAGSRGDTAAGPRHGGVGNAALARRHNPYGVYRAAQWHVPGATGTAGTAHTSGGTHGGMTGGGGCPLGGMARGNGLQLLHPAHEPCPWADPRDGGGHHQPHLDGAGTARLPRPAPAVATAQTTRATVEDDTLPHRTVAHMTTVSHTPTHDRTMRLNHAFLQSGRGARWPMREAE